MRFVVKIIKIILEVIRRMKRPFAQETVSQKETISAFGGYNHNPIISENQFYDMKNIVGDKYPLLSQRRVSGVALGESSRPLCYVNDLFSADTLMFETNEGTAWFTNDANYHKQYGNVVYNHLGGGAKEIVRMGAYMLSFPQGKYASLYDKDDFGEIGYSIKLQRVTLYPCTSEGLRITPTSSDTAPTNPSDGDYWVDTSGEQNVLKVYSSAYEMWSVPPATYMMMNYGYADGDAEGNWQDFYTDSGGSCKMYIKKLADDTDAEIENAELKNIVSTDEAGVDIYISSVAKDWTGNDTPIFKASLFSTQYIAKDCYVMFVREAPRMDYVVECNNRLWGCRYAYDEYGQQINEIYASKLGDFKNWRVYQGISTDAYAVTVGRGGKFTGACVYQGRPIFFKEDCMIIIYGDYPAQYQLQYIDCRGVANGSHKSIAVVDEILYYHNAAGICAYNGSLPTLVSSAFGEERYKNAIACANESKYYVCMQNMASEYVLFMYDAPKGMWFKFGNEQIKAFASHGGELYYIDSDDNVRIMNGGEIQSDEKVEWMAETGIMGISTDEKKYITKISVKASVSQGAMIRIYIEYDSCGDWELMQTVTGYRLQTYNFGIPIRKCDHFRLKLEGVGESLIYSITKTIEYGSDK